MKKIINGVRYDTEKMIEIGFVGRRDGRILEMKSWNAGLYASKRSGRYCLAGNGGAMSRFAQSAGQNSWGPGADLIPMSKAEALDWAEQYLDAGAIEDHFGDMIEDA